MGDVSELAHDWICLLDPENRKIATIDQFDPNPPIPKWCPLRKK
jgi:hypothetical protein